MWSDLFLKVQANICNKFSRRSSCFIFLGRQRTSHLRKGKKSDNLVFYTFIVFQINLQPKMGYYDNDYFSALKYVCI